MERKSGVLMHISSLPGDQGIGTFGDEARKFVDFLSKAHQTYWQILPLGPTSYGDSPYQSFSTFAGNPYFIDLDYLKRDGLLMDSDYKNICWGESLERVDYATLFEKRYPVLRKASKNLMKHNNLEEYHNFLKDNEYWLEDYALFMSIKEANNNVGLDMWPKELRLKDEKALKKFSREHTEDIEFWKTIQYLFYKQFYELRNYAHSKGIYLIGDCPIYVARDSADIWANPELFDLDSDLVPKKVAGCPPDGFSVTGQLWGNPLYNWKVHKKTNYAWWLKRIGNLLNMYDYLRIDHFRGISSYYAVKYGEPTAENGKWLKGPGKDLIKAFKNNFKEDRIIAEDLGFITKDVRDLLSYSGYPGMAVLEFAFDSRDAASNDYIPHNMHTNSVGYCGTHDNETIMGWIHSIPDYSYQYAKEYMNIRDDEGFNWGMIRTLWASAPNVVLVQAQDLLGLDNSARMNHPSTVGNWIWRAKKGVFTDELGSKLRYLSHLYGRA